MARVGVEIATELKLGLPGSPEEVVNEKKRVFSEVEGGGSTASGGGNKSQVVGWPPVCSYRRKNVETASSSKGYVKVSMDGAPFLRKIDLGTLCGYSELAEAMEKLFGCFGIGEAMKDGENCSELMPIYEDKDGDWMLIGDVPWQMFVETCKRLRIMKKSEAKGFGLQLKGASKD